MDPQMIGAVLDRKAVGIKSARDKYQQRRDGGWTRQLQGPLAVRPVTWLRAGLYYDLDKVDRQVRPYFGKIVRSSVIVMPSL